MKLKFGIFVVCFSLPQVAFGVDFPVATQPVSNTQVATDLDFVAFPVSGPNSDEKKDLEVVDFPKPKSETDLEIVAFPEHNNSMLKATQFPKTIQDLSFKSRMDLLSDGFSPYEIVYENGVCVSGCAYPGITFAEDMAAVDAATEEMAELIEEEEETPESTPPEEVFPSASGWCYNGKSTKLPLRYPVDMSNFKYKLTSDFGYRPSTGSFHPAVDIGCPVGTPVYATADGVVKYIKTDSNDRAGYWIGIEHDNGLITQYLHLGKILVKLNQRVRACEQIAFSGSTGKSKNGSSYKAHLDYRIRFKSDANKFVDILCPCKISNKKNQTSADNDLDMTCAHSLFNAQYKFVKYNQNSDDKKRSLWRVEHGHCMNSVTDLLPDEVAP